MRAYGFVLVTRASKSAQSFQHITTTNGSDFDQLALIDE